MPFIGGHTVKLCLSVRYTEFLLDSECPLSEVQGPDESNGRSCVHSPLFEEFPQLCLGGGQVVWVRVDHSGVKTTGYPVSNGQNWVPINRRGLFIWRQLHLTAAGRRHTHTLTLPPLTPVCSSPHTQLSHCITCISLEHISAESALCHTLKMKVFNSPTKQ